MQSSTSTVPPPEAILDWLKKEVGYRPQGGHHYDGLPSPESLRMVCRGNMVPVFNFLLNRVKSEKTVEKIRRNILVHGGGGAEEVGDERGGRGGKPGKEKGSGSVEAALESSKEAALKEREAAEREVRRLRTGVQRMRKELQSKMVEASREEADRKRLLDERENCR